MSRLRNRGAFIALAILGATSLGMMSETGAAVLQPFHVSPTSGPIGTVVNVSGSQCMPSALPSSSNYVTVTSTTFPLNTNIPVAANGSWHGAFRIPANALALPGLVDAVCFTNGQPSTATVYAPQTFTVTAGATTPGSGSGNGGGVTTPGGGTTANPGTGSGAGSGNGSGNNGGGSAGAIPGSGGGSNLGGSNGSSGNAGNTGALTATKAAAASAAKHAASASTGTSKHHFPWWILLVALVIALAGALALSMRRKHEIHHDGEPVPSVS